MSNHLVTRKLFEAAKAASASIRWDSACATWDDAPSCRIYYGEDAKQNGPRKWCYLSHEVLTAVNLPTRTVQLYDRRTDTTESALCLQT